MTMRLVRAPWWAQALGVGVVYVAVQVVLGRLAGGEPHYVPAVFGGLVFGALVGPQVARQQRRLRAAAQPLPLVREEEALRAALGGPVPAEPAVRDAARRVARHRQQELVSTNRRAAIALPVLVLATTVLALSVSRWLLVSSVIVAGIGVHQVLLLPRRIERRLVLLSAAPSSHPSSRAEGGRHS